MNDLDTRSLIDHLIHMTDGHWHDSCPWCLTRRREGGTGLTDAERSSVAALHAPSGRGRRTT